MKKTITIIALAIVFLWLFVPNEAKKKQIFLDSFHKLEIQAKNICGQSNPEEWKRIQFNYKKLMVEYDHRFNDLTTHDLKVISKYRVEIQACWVVSTANKYLSSFPQKKSI